MPRNTSNKATQAEYERRVGEMIELILLGAPRRKILQLIAKGEDEKLNWKVKPRQIDGYIAAAKAAIKVSGIFNKDEELGKAIERLNNLYQQSYELDDFKSCLAVQKELSELLGLKTLKLEITIPGKIRRELVKPVAKKRKPKK